ncbi:bifunctional diguanylate cyclase/phosphodiesterase [Bacillus xiapuensis]|uniref:bifunctional diguanylate cyclase/phosphodiesterase n=1 Tax=Bacillus xiapuensis TaxID=2014075 RepID=UPI0018E260D8|nr:EAL domain-containing protein [Bacillus xiapuensis]
MFSTPSAASFKILQGDYAGSIVLLSIAMACAASYTAIIMNERAQQNSFFHRTVWLILASVSMGIGIWSMHFIGMSALMLPVSMHYDHWLTLISIGPALIASFLAFYFSNRPSLTISSYVMAGIVMGAGISVMHYIGMAAMKMKNVVISYDIRLFIASIVVAVVVSFIALYILAKHQRKARRRFVRLLVSAILGMAVSCMHYTGMAAVHFYVPKQLPLKNSGHHLSDMAFLIGSTTAAITVLFVLFLLSSLLDRYVEHRFSYYDSLTKLPNRREFEKNVNSNAYPAMAVWHFHDLDLLHHSYSYAFLDDVIQQTSELLASVKPPLAELYRLDGQRFAFAVRDEKAVSELRQAMTRAAFLMNQPLVIDGHVVRLQSLCAFADAEQKVPSAELYGQALAVLSHPGAGFHNEVIAYDPEIHAHTMEREIMEGIDRALAENELYLVYQPKVATDQKEMIGVEALLRWKHPKYGILSPAVFIPVLEKYHRMMDVTDWVIDRVCQQILAWQVENSRSWRVAINIPGHYVSSPRLLEYLLSTTRRYQIDPEFLELEITETSFVKTIDGAIQAVDRFRKEGFEVALDDFGTGVSSLSYLKKIPISTLKIDKSFIDGGFRTEKDASIIQSIILLGKSLNLKVVVEGVETEEQAAFLAKSCHYPIIQGYYFSKPLPADELVEWNKRFIGQA